MQLENQVRISVFRGVVCNMCKLIMTTPLLEDSQKGATRNTNVSFRHVTRLWLMTLRLFIPQIICVLMGSV